MGRKKSKPKRIAAIDKDPFRFPFAWLRHVRVKRGRPPGSITSPYGKAIDLRVRVPERILAVLNTIAREHKISLGQLVSEFCAAGIEASKKQGKLRQIAKRKAPLPHVPDGQQFDWTGIDSDIHPSKKIADLNPPETNSEEEQ